MEFDTITGILGNLAGIFLSLWVAAMFWPARKRKSGDSGGFTVHVSASSFASASSRDSNSAPSSSAATVHVKSASGTVRSQTLRISRKEYRSALSRIQRKA